MTETTIRALEDHRYQALVEGEWDVFERVCHPELSYVHSTAVIDSRASYVAKLRDGHYVYHRISHPIDRVVVVGEVAMVFGQMTADVTAGGVEKQLDSQALAVWRLTDGEWLFYAYQPTVRP